jgi:hypothetical protein
MNILPVYLYSNLLGVILDLDQNGRIHKIMYQRTIKLQKGFENTVRIQFQNSDQKPVSISSGTFYMDLLDTEGRQSVLDVSKPITVLETTSGTTVTNKGVASITFNAEDTIKLTAGNYKFIIKKTTDGGQTYTPAYANTYYGITGDIQLVEDGFPVGYPIQTVDLKELETNKEFDRTFGNMGYMFVSGWLRPVVRPTTDPTTSTAHITLASFVGDITVEVTQDKSPSAQGHANAQFTTATTFSTSTVTHGIQTLTWNGPYSAVRFRVRPKNDVMGINYYPTGNPVGSGTSKFPSGFVDQIQFIS